MIIEPKTTEEYLIYLCACVLNDTVPDEKPADVEWGDVFSAAKKHSITSTAWYSVDRSSDKPDDEVWEEWNEAKNKATVKSIIQKSTLDEITALLTDNGIRCLPLKGSVIKDLYPHPDMRVMADLDILVDSDRMSQVRDLLSEKGFSCEHFGTGNHDVYMKPPVINIEIHRSLMPKELEVLCDYYEDGFSHGIPSDGDQLVYHMPPEELYVFVTAHLYKHYLGGGTGIRSLMDIHMIRKAYDSVWDEKKIDRMLNDLGIFDFEKEIRELSEYWFGPADRPESLQKKIDYICESGTYGTMKHILDNQVKKQGKYRFFLERLLPSFDTMCQLYPWLRKAPVMLPVCWSMRLINAIITKPGIVFYQIKTILGSNELAGE